MNNECSKDNKCVISTCTKPEKHISVILALPLLGEKIFYLVKKTKPTQILCNTIITKKL